MSNLWFLTPTVASVFMGEHGRCSAAGVFVIEFDAVGGGDYGHMIDLIGGTCQARVARIYPSEDTRKAACITLTLIN